MKNFIKTHKILLVIISLIIIILFILLFVSPPERNSEKKSEENSEQTKTQLISYDNYDELYSAIEKSFQENNEEAEDFYLALYLGKAYWDESVTEKIPKRLLPFLEQKSSKPTSFISGKFDKSFLDWFFLESYSMWDAVGTRETDNEKRFSIANAEDENYVLSIIAFPRFEAVSIIGGEKIMVSTLALTDPAKKINIVYYNKNNPDDLYVPELDSSEHWQYVWQPTFNDLDNDGVPEIFIRRNVIVGDGFYQALSIYKLKDEKLSLMKEFIGKAEGIARRLENGLIEVGEGMSEENEGHLSYSKFRLTTYEFKNGDFLKKSEKIIPHILLSKDWDKYYENY